ncbi:NmrA family NAD(P)-binding protein [Idiomarina sp. Sol25]|uniref:SDR family oxidoreductase n=1 Tax=Idiomarina sp. Sol25 TaxID=3064000 RepID=UPI00294B0C6C|nr:NmrA family NAD(P)-binding protein [Idiomarina sp. Sol25]MDV6328538.1 NmrA family NAD(P)-binding protein [Idiomarina sp. Sol25]
MKTLIIGATGQLGSRLVQKRNEFITQNEIKAFVRPSSDYKKLNCQPSELVFGDLTDKQSLIDACAGIDTVIATATLVFPRVKDCFELDERAGYQNLIEACELCGVKQIIFISIAVPMTTHFTRHSKTYELKKWCEELLISSSVSHTIIRCPLFMDDYFALIGSEIPLAGEKLATVNRSKGITKLLRSFVRRSIEKYGLAWIPGNAHKRQAFIAVEDIAKYCIRVTQKPEFYNRVLTIGGPEDLSWHDVCEVYSELLARKVRPVTLPAPVLFLLSKLTRPFSTVLANQLSILWIIASKECVREAYWDQTLPMVEMLTAKHYLAHKFQRAKVSK